MTSPTGPMEHPVDHVPMGKPPEFFWLSVDTYGYCTPSLGWYGKIRGIPESFENHPFNFRILHEINHPAIGGTPMIMETPGRFSWRPKKKQHGDFWPWWSYSLMISMISMFPRVNIYHLPTGCEQMLAAPLFHQSVEKGHPMIRVANDVYLLLFHLYPLYVCITI